MRICARGVFNIYAEARKKFLRVVEELEDAMAETDLNAEGIRRVRDLHKLASEEEPAFDDFGNFLQDRWVKGTEGCPARVQQAVWLTTVDDWGNLSGSLDSFQEWCNSLGESTRSVDENPGDEQGGESNSEIAP